MFTAIRLTDATVDVLEVLTTHAGRDVYGLEVAQSSRRPTGTVYPLLARLERQGWIKGQWDVAEEARKGPRRRYYRLTGEGAASAERALARRRADAYRSAPVTSRGRPADSPALVPANVPVVVREFVTELRLVRMRAGAPSLRALSALTFYSAGALSAAFSGRSLPSAPLLESIVRACGADPGEWSARLNLAEQSVREGVHIPYDFGDFYPLGVRWARQALSGRWRTTSPDEEADVVQEAMLLACEQWNAVRAGRDIKAWVVAQARWCASRSARQRLRDDALAARVGEQPDARLARNPVDIAEQRLLAGEILGRVDPATARMVLLRSQGFTVSEIADMHATTTSIVEARLTRLRRVARLWVDPVKGDGLTDYLRLLRVQAGEPSIRDLASRVGYSHTTVHRVMSGRTRGAHQWVLVKRLIEAMGGSLSEAEALGVGSPAEAEALGVGSARGPAAGESAPKVSVDSVDAYSMWALAEKLEKAGRSAEAADLWRPAAEAGDTEAMWVLADKLEGAGRIEEAESWLTTAAEKGDVAAAQHLAARLEHAGSLEAACDIWKSAASHGDPTALQETTRLLRRLGRVAEARDLWERQAATGNRLAMRELSALLARTGHPEQACAVWRTAANAGDLPAMLELAPLLTETGRPAEAERWLRLAADTGDWESIRALADLLERRGAIEEAEFWLHRLVGEGDANAMSALSSLLERNGKFFAACQIWRSRAEGGNRYAMWHLAALFERSGRPEEAAAWKVRAAGNDEPCVELELTGTEEERRETWLRRSAKAANPVAPVALADLLVQAGRDKEARQVLREAVADGNQVASTALAELLRKEGRIAEALEVYEGVGPSVRR
ncbi:helix-turn-helix domain-containing protein [Nonomuraea sp. NPDC046570]|uniref:helix-turn-helix domain-containing protein n=1 Tax=Nonomuraea sp. NPDC046570 TaxID=3155255 RepID=UPI0033F72BEE